MPDRRRHRGAHPEDARLFAAAQVSRLRRAVDELSWLLGRDYAGTSALKLVGDHHQLHRRQRIGVMRCACSDQALRVRRQSELAVEQVAGRPLLIDGYNVLTSVEAALAGGVLLLGRDACLRDMASMHGSYRKVHETGLALTHIGNVLQMLRCGSVHWYLDAPVSNSGRLRGLMTDLAERRGWSWQIEIVASPDHVLIESTQPIASADSVVIDAEGPWFNLARYVIESMIDQPWVIDLGANDGKEVRDATNAAKMSL